MLIILTVFCLLLIQASSQVYPPAPVHFIPDGTPFTVPDVPLRTIYINPNGGNDANDGLSTSRALRTLSEAWDRVPRGALAAGQGVRLVLLPGQLGLSDIPEYWEDRWGSPQAPIILTSLSGDATSVTVGRINMFNCSHVYMMGFTIASPNDPLHCERCAGLHLRGMRVLGNVGSADTWETIKLNQCYSVYIEGCDVAGAGDNAIDMVAVQYGHVMGSAIHDANWCMYLKGGSAYFLISGNRVYDCGESGLSLGQGTGLQYMVEPWIQYEAYDIRVVNNLVYDVWGAGLGVMGGVNILMAYNTLVRVGSRSHAVEFLTGSRVCDFDDASVRCTQLRSRGGWGPTAPGQDEVPIPNLNVHFLNNIIANPPDNTTQWSHMEVRRGGTPASGGVPGPEARADTGLLIAGNMFWNGGADMPIGIDDPEDLPCPATLAPGASPPASCMVAQLRRDNAFNPPGQLPPFLATPATATPPSFIPATSGVATPLTDPRAAAATAQAVLVAPLPAFPAWPLPSVPSGVTAASSIPRDLAGRVRAGHDYPGAFASEGATGGASPSPSPSPSPLPSPAPSPSPSASPSPSPSPNSSPTSSPSPQPSPSPSPSPKGKGKGKPKKPVARKPKKPKKQRGRMML